MLRNPSDETVAIRWNEATIVDGSHQSHRATHEGVRILQASTPTPDTMIPPGADVSDQAIAADRIKWTGVAWQPMRLFDASDIQGDIRIMLPIVINDATHDYLFIFKPSVNPKVLDEARQKYAAEKRRSASARTLSSSLPAPIPVRLTQAYVS